MIQRGKIVALQSDTVQSKTRLAKDCTFMTDSFVKIQRKELILCFLDLEN